MKQSNSLVNQDGSHKYQSHSYLRKTITTATMTIATTAPSVAPAIIPDLFSVPDI